MKRKINFSSIRTTFILFLMIGMPLGLLAQQQTVDQYNLALQLSKEQRYSEAIDSIDYCLYQLENNESYWLDGDASKMNFVFKVYRLTYTVLQNIGENELATEYFEDLVYYVSEYFYESEVVDKFNSTALSPGMY